MFFNSFQFAVFFCVVYALFVVSPPRGRRAVLLVSSFVFYALWVPLQALLLAASLAVNHAIARRMSGSARPKRLLVVSVAFSLSFLAVFKYSALALSLLRPHFPSLAATEANVGWLPLPLGISFYTFEMVSLAVDVYEGRLPCPSWDRYALFVTFFPHLVAGPIMRGRELLPQLETAGERTPLRTRRGIWLFVTGLVKKAILSDYLLLPAVNEAFDAPGKVSAPVHLVGLYSFAFLIYFDFSGYTDMARGIAAVLGFELPVNFQEPYLSRSPSEFWRRWHMTLSRWLRDYLYVPLGGNRRGALRTHLNLFVTMVLGGLWHGAGLNFAVWGAMHGLLLVLFRLARREPRGAEDRPLRWSDAPRIFLVFHAVCLAWVPFRSPTFRATLDYYRGLFSTDYARPWPVMPLLVVLLCVLLHALERGARPRLAAMQRRAQRAPWGPALEGALLGALVTGAVLASGAGVQFIYFQF